MNNLAREALYDKPPRAKECVGRITATRQCRRLAYCFKAPMQTIEGICYGIRLAFGYHQAQR